MMTTSLHENDGVDVRSAREDHASNHLDAWIAALGIAAILIAYTIREFAVRVHAAEVVTNLA